MLRKPFRTPFLRTADDLAKLDDYGGSEPAAKKRRIDDDPQVSKTGAAPKLTFKTPGISTLPRKPLRPLHNIDEKPVTESVLEGGSDRYYNVLW